MVFDITEAVTRKAVTASFFCCIIGAGGTAMYKHRVEIRDGEAIIVGHLYIPDEESDRLWDEGVLNQERLDLLRHKDLHAKE